MKQPKHLREAQFNRSYRAYYRDWHNWKNKGYSMEPSESTGRVEPLSKTEYAAVYKAAQRAGEKNIAGNLAKSQRLLTRQEASDLRKRLLEHKGADESFDAWLDKKVRSAMQLAGNIGDYVTEVSGKEYQGKQALYLDLMFLFGDTVANEVYGY